MPARILVVDDEPSIRDVLEIALEDEGYAVSTASDGAVALTRMMDQQFDLVISDWMMPVMDGQRLARELRRQGKRTPFVLISASRFSPHLEAVDLVINKPFDLDDLIQAVGDLLPRAS